MLGPVGPDIRAVGPDIRVIGDGALPEKRLVDGRPGVSEAEMELILGGD
jgi:hypothetical protein